MKERIAKLVFLVVQLIIYYFSIFTKSVYIDLIRYSSIVLSFLFAFFYFNKKRYWKFGRQFIIGGLLFTCAADYFLVALNDQFELGLLLFIVAQYCYFLYLSTELDSLQRMHLLGVRLGGALIGITVSFLLVGKMIPLLILAIAYASLFISNIVTAFRSIKRYLLFSIGLVLYAMCDVCVTLTHMKFYITNLPHESVFRTMIWVFYIPSQVCIALSACQKILEKEEKIC